MSAAMEAAAGSGNGVEAESVSSHKRCCRLEAQPSTEDGAQDLQQPLGPLHIEPSVIAAMSEEQVLQLRRVWRQHVAIHVNAQAAAGAVPAGAMSPIALRNGGDAAAEAQSNDMSIVDAVKLGLFTVVKKIVEQPPRPLDELLAQRDADGHTLAHWAAKRGDVQLLQYLAAKGAPLFLRSDDTVGMQPLHWAATEGHLPTMHFLICQGADTNCRDRQQCTPLLIAAQYGQTEAVAYLVKNGADTSLVDVNRDSAMHWAAYKGQLSICQLLSHLGLPTDEPDAFGQTPLHLASLRGNLAVVEYLVLDADASISRKDNSDATPLDLAIKKDKKRVAAFLKSRVVEPFSWRRVLTKQQWQVWFVGGGTADSSSWPFYLAVVTKLWCHVMFPLRLLTESGALALAGYGTLELCCIWTQAAMWVFFLLAWKTDPGYIDPNSELNRREYDAALEHFSHQGMDAMISSGTEMRRPMLCHSCHVKRPVRSKHCKICRKCVRMFDHHCPFIGNCVGEGNYRFFFLYVVTTGLAIIQFLWLCAAFLRKARFDPLVVVSFLYLTFMGLMVMGLAGYHLQLISMNLTTNEHHNFWRYEHFKDGQGRTTNPFDRGVLRNCTSRLCHAAVGERRPRSRDPDSQRLLRVV